MDQGQKYEKKNNIILRLSQWPDALGDI